MIDLFAQIIISSTLDFSKASIVYFITSLPLIFSSNLFDLPKRDDVPPAVIIAQIFITESYHKQK